MAIRSFLAMTAPEIAENPYVSANIAWMGCHFSPGGQELTDLPRQLPAGSLLTLNDRFPLHGHDPKRMAEQLTQCIRSLHLWGLLLDLQRPGCEETHRLVRYLLEALPCPVAVSSLYAKEVNCPVFLPPAAPSVPLEEHFAPWNGREIWLELALDAEAITLTDRGAVTTPLPSFPRSPAGHREQRLHCHYTIAQCPEGFRFSLWRTKGDLEDLLAEAARFPVSTAVGLWQELG